MNDQIVGQLKSLESRVQDLIHSQKNSEQSLEKLKSIENLLERMASNSDRVTQAMEVIRQQYDKARETQV